MKHCVFGGQYGSEGKGSVTEWLCKQAKKPVAVFGDNSPNSGHSNSRGKVRNIPAAAFYADTCVLGPDAVIDSGVLIKDIETLRQAGSKCQIYCHENAAMVAPEDIARERANGLESSISSTCTGSGHARFVKYYSRVASATIRQSFLHEDSVAVLGTVEYLNMVDSLQQSHDLIFECGHGVLLDTNFGRYPYVTSRSTLPHAALTRNGLDPEYWIMCGVYRTFPIRTGGNSGPTGGKEISWEKLGVEKEIATVTKRIRRVFEWNMTDFSVSLRLTRPDSIFFTHLDYLPWKHDTVETRFRDWDSRENILESAYEVSPSNVFISEKCGEFMRYD